MISTTQVWENVLIEIQARVTAFAYESWIEGLVPVCIYEDNVVLLCENSAKKRVVEERYIDVISESCKKVMPHNEGVLFILGEEREKYEKYANADIGEINSENIIVQETTCSFSPKCTFDNFIVGKSNEFAAAASKAVAQNPGTKYNPLFIYGGVGLGKTHLLNAIGNHIRKTNPKLRCMNISCERFTNELIEALRGNKHTDEMKEFRKRYRSVDVLMIDDIQFISEPDLETRIAILKSEALAEKQSIDDEILKLIANKVTTNIREMKGVLTKIICYSQLICKNVNDMEVVNSALKDYNDDKTELVTIDKIVDCVCKYYPNVTKKDIIGKKKTKEIVEPRQMCVYLVTELLTLPLLSIGQYFGGRDHTTIMYTRDKMADLVANDPRYAAQAKDIKDMIFGK